MRDHASQARGASSVSEQNLDGKDGRRETGKQLKAGTVEKKFQPQDWGGRNISTCVSARKHSRNLEKKDAGLTDVRECEEGAYGGSGFVRTLDSPGGLSVGSFFVSKPNKTEFCRDTKK